MDATKAKTRKARFEAGDRVGFWSGKEVGTVDETWFDGAKEMVSVVWDSSGCSSEHRAYQLAFASA